MANILIAYSTVDGHTKKICERLRAVVEQADHQVDLAQIDDDVVIDIESFDKVVIGASIRYGKHRQAVYNFVRRHRGPLENKPCAFFSVNVVARKISKNQPDTNPYVQKFLSATSWQPTARAVFAGKIDYPKYSFLDRQIIRLILWIGGGPTDPRTVVDFTDWNKVDDFGRQITAM